VRAVDIVACNCDRVSSFGLSELEKRTRWGPGKTIIIIMTWMNPGGVLNTD